MGLLRTLLAIAVVFAHCYGYVFTGSVLSVEMFYVISGFLMSFILTEARTYASVGQFYANRFLRLFPLYWLVAAITLIMFIAAGLLHLPVPFWQVYSSVDWPTRILLATVNVTLFGQSLDVFTGIHNGALQFFSNFRTSEVLLYKGALVPQAWTLDLELTFYLIAPFVLPRRWLVWTLLAASLGVRLWLFRAGLAFQDLPLLSGRAGVFPVRVAVAPIAERAHVALAASHAGSPQHYRHDHHGGI